MTAPAHAGGALPSNGQYVAGQGSISGTSSSVTVNQSSSRGIINWGSFSIGAGNQVLFNNGSGATLNRVMGGDLSRIDGSLKATGSVYLINPQGIVIGPGGQVIANGSFVASTRDVSNNAFMSGGAFSASGTSNGSIINQGVITSNTGDAILVGSSVTNTGSISAPSGTVGLAAGNEITLQPAGSDPRIAISGGAGSVTNAGNIRAAQAELNAAGGNVYALVENNGGIISATGTQTINGHVWLTAGGTGTVRVAGNVTAENANGNGGDVTVRGYAINIPGTINASASAANGAGGNVSVVATNNTTVSGAIHAGGGVTGQGGAIETSGHTLSFGGSHIDAGKGGSWLLDPYDLDVDATAATTIDNSLEAGTSVTLQTTATGASGPGNQNASGQGDININAPLTWDTSATLTLDAYRSIVITAGIAVQGGGGVVLITNHGGTGGDLSFGLGPSGFAGNIQFTGTEGSGQSLTINGSAYTLIYSMDEFQAVNNNLSGNYALAQSLNFTQSSWIPLGTDGAGNLLNSSDGFTGTF
ncbi:MAG TPA: filamentous hemagglutinin N-terminal domain-containing protein, partial [Rhizomicrobium sp.]|nr:filamentous hemagglutinin N-terminal domain-containing protein [Rhizomicrobium sp.]